MISQVDFILRLIAIGSGLMLIALLMANEVRARIKLPLVGMIVGMIGYLLNSTPLMMTAGELDPLVDLVSISAPFWIWLFARRLFDREPEGHIIIGAAIALAIGWAVGNFIPSAGRTGFLLVHIVGLTLIGDLVRVGILEREDDLVEKRRVIRVWLPLLVAAQAGGILLFELVEMFTGLDGQFPVAQLINSLLILIVTLFAGLALLRTDPELLGEGREDQLAEPESNTPNLTPSEAVLYEKLTVAMEQGAYRETGLTITRLAARLDTQEHRLRSLINGRLGHRNFSAFLNQHRISEAKSRLANREAVDIPILTIAMDLGYNSLATFNRAFRGETGTTPSEFRRKSIGEAPVSATPAD